MKITKRKITAATDPIKIPAPFNKYYQIQPESEVEEMTGEPAHPSPCEECPGYAVKTVAFLKPQPEYEEYLSNNGIDYVDLLQDTDNGEYYIGYVVHDRIYTVTEDDLPEYDDEEYDDEEYDFGDRDEVAQEISDFLMIDTIDAYIIYDWYAEEDAFDDFDSIEDFLNYLETDIYDMLDACDDEIVKERILDAIEGSTKVTAHADIPADEPKKPVSAKTWMGKYTTVDGDTKKVYFDFDSEDFEETEDYFLDSIPVPYSDAKLLGSAPAKGLLEKDGFAPLEACDYVSSAIDTGMEYWYFGRHGIGPGTIPQGVTVLDTVEIGWDTWMLLDKLLTTDELNTYDLKEEWPPEGSVSHNGTVIEGATVAEMQRAVDEYSKQAGKIGEQLDDLQQMMLKKNKKMQDKVKGSECTKVNETEDTINYVVSSEDIEAEEPVEAMSLVNYKNYRILPNTYSYCWDVLNPDSSLVKSGFKNEKEARDYIDTELTACNNVFGDEEVVDVAEEEDDFATQPDQEYSSAETAINGKQGKLPAVFKKADIPHGALVLDYGGGTVESEAVAQDYLNDFDAVEMLYDPFNQTTEHNREVVKSLKENGGADVAICSNVLNVIKETEVRLDVLTKINRLMKNGATAYISVYEGGGSGEGAATQNGRSYQNKRKLATYLEEVQQVFPEATKKGAVIIAPKTVEASVAAAIDVDSIDTNALTNEIKENIIEFFSAEGWGEDAESFAKDYTFVQVERVIDGIVVEVRAELGYDEMIRLSSEYLDPIIQEYDEDAYFDMEDAGIMSAFIQGPNIFGKTAVEGGWMTREQLDRYNDRMLAEHERRWLDPDNHYKYDDEYEEEKDDLVTEFDFDITVEIEEGGTWKVIEGDPLYHADIFTDEGVEEEQMLEDFEETLQWNLPDEEGQYKVKGRMKLVYEWDTGGYWEGGYRCRYRDSIVTAIELTKVGKVESSTKVEAAMTEEELDDAILEGRPFTLDDFRKYKGPVPEEGALLAGDLQVGDVIEITEDASEVNLGTCVEILSINDPEENWIDYTFQCKVVDNPNGTDWMNQSSLKVGDIILLHFDADEYVGVKLEEV